MNKFFMAFRKRKAPEHDLQGSSFIKLLCCLSRSFSNSFNQGLKPVLTETAITGNLSNFWGTLTITIKIRSKNGLLSVTRNHAKKQNVFKVAILRMLKFAQSVEYAQKNRFESLPVTHVMVERSFSSLHYTRSPRFKRPYFRKPHLKLHVPPLLFCFSLKF